MKALAIVALVFAGVAIVVPVVGVFLAMFCSILSLIAFRAQPTLSGIAFGINVINTVFLSPSILVSGIRSSSGASEAGNIYIFYIGFHVVLLAIAIIWRLIRGAPKNAVPPPASA